MLLLAEHSFYIYTTTIDFLALSPVASLTTPS